MAPVSDAGLQSLALVLVKESSWGLRSSVKDWDSPDLPEGQPAQVITEGFVCCKSCEEGRQIQNKFVKYRLSNPKLKV